MRWKGFITLAVLAALLFVTAVFFSDDIIEQAIEKSGTGMWGARVEVSGVDVVWSPLGVRINGLAVASRKEEYKNALYVSGLKCMLLAAPLLEKKIIIEDISGTGLAFNTDRKSSGFLPSAKREKREKVKKEWKTNMSSWMQDIKGRGLGKIDVKASFDVNELASLKALEGIENSLSGFRSMYGNYDTSDLNKSSDELGRAIGMIDDLKIKDAKDLEKAGKKLKEAQPALENAEKTGKQLGKDLKEMQSSVSDLEKKLREFDDLRQADYRRMMEKLKLPSLETQDIARTVFGPLIVDKFNMIMEYRDKARKYIPAKKEKGKPEVKEREKGEDIIFYRKKMYPPFHLKKALVSGQDNAKIECTDISDAPWITGKPAVIEAVYADFSFRAEIDRTGDVPGEKISGRLDNFRLADSTGVMNIDLEFSGDMVKGSISWVGKGLLPADWASYLDLGDTPVKIDVSVSGKDDNLKFDIRSNLDSMLSAKLKKELAKKMEEARGKVNALIDSNVLGRKNKVMGDLASFKSEKLDRLNSEKDQLERRKKELDKKIEAKKKEAKDKTDKLKKDSEDKIKKGAEDKLKDIFK
ncbi:MAG: TIGR03545 family protein [Elusimicrobia bacterium]|nr:TIGR03545 family protein [Elusimicrobiota bacterium]